LINILEVEPNLDLTSVSKLDCRQFLMCDAPIRDKY